MIVCHCTGARDQDIQSAAERGVRSVAEIGQQCGAGACCGGCLPLIRELLSAPAAAARAPVPPAHPEPAPEH
jgi:bacterioferritin-associated ferredoxin